MPHEGTVYLIAQPTIAKHGRQPDLSSLARYGEIKVLIAAGEAPGNYPERALALIESRLEHFDPAKDFIVWCGGDTIAAILTGVVLERMQVDGVRWLRFDRDLDTATGKRLSTGAYSPIDIDLLGENDPEQMDMFHNHPHTKVG